MKFKMIAAMLAVVALAGVTSAQAQDCGCSAYSGVVEGGCGGFGSYGFLGFAKPDCNRGISSAGASSLWAGYSTDDCSYKGPTRQGLLGSCKLRHGGGCGLSGGGGGCGAQGCFGYPSGGCGCGSSFAGATCGGGCRLKQKLSAKGGCGQRGGCLTGGCGGGCKLLGRLKARHQSSCGCSAPVSECSSCLSGACDSCGSCGGYFDEAIGYEYGNGGMQSYVGGSLTSACGCGG